MSQSIVIQVGQCGNQVGGRFWDLILQEHSKYNKYAIYDDAMSTFFRNVDERNGIERIPLGDGRQKIVGLKARGILVDMEEGVLNQIKRSSFRELFDERQIVSGISGSGNNWGVGYHVYGSEYRESIMETIRHEAELCDSLQSFFMINSAGGGTGSGLGSWIAELVRDEYPNVYKFSNIIIPSPNDDVVTSPYNSVLCLSKLMDCADCILPVDNQSLYQIYDRIVSSAEFKRKRGSTLIDSGQSALSYAEPSKSKKEAFNTMNNIVANLLVNMTSSMRFEGRMNVDINDIVTNLVPFPSMNFLFSSMTPLYTLADVNVPSRRLEQMFTDAFSPECQLVSANPKSSAYLASALIVRGPYEISELRKNIDRLNKTLTFPKWNSAGWKTGLCDNPPLGQEHSLLALSNNCAISEVLSRLRDRFLKLYKRKANLHHYTDNMDVNEFQEAQRSLKRVIADYEAQQAKCYA